MGACLFVLPWVPSGAGGVNETVLSLARELKASGRFDPIIGVTSWSGSAPPQEIRGIPLIGLRLRGVYDEGAWKAAKSAARLPAELAGLARLLRTHEVQIVNLHFPTIAGAAFVLLRRLGWYRGKVALTFHGSDIARVSRLEPARRRVWQHYIAGADEVFVCSHSLAGRVRAVCGQREPRVVHNGADVELFSGARRRRRHPGPKRILHVGKFERNKSQDVLLAAFRLLLERQVDCTLTMIGAPGPELEQVKRAAAAFGERVTVLVDIEHRRIPGYMADAELFVLPSRAEAFGIVLIEAGATGLPVVATNVGGIPEIISDAATGLLVEPDNARALADAMARVLQNDALAGRLASGLHAQALRYTWRRAADQLIAALC
ncbi:MAG: glycosyltransferase family 4 protein [Gammaproteobacteria bacterium]|nr:glycosyltransferase family 4 protein [Gammaproteobacteria bacterium]MBV8307003.1 glycosyltransferase family 4 protein [Gammaproteobacteria bacterium]MBV8405291.1 glycosyltransferase family 4 protein [Gammaproteobacteria bacterium]